MLSMSDRPIDQFFSFFANTGLSVSFIVPTPTGYRKSIMDAIAPLRDFLSDGGIHDYNTQGLGPDNKVTIPSFFVHANSLEETTASLYRPMTKNGDPRIWFANLKNYCQPYNLLAIFASERKLFVINLSDDSITYSLEHGGYAAQVVHNAVELEGEIANQLILELRDIHNKGFVPSVVEGDTGVGMTLEHHLGIIPNSSRLPDYKGIEIKASRVGLRVPNRVNLFSQVPDWTNSKGISAEKLLRAYGYWAKTDSGKRFNLYCTVGAIPNAQGLYFDVDFDSDLLVNYARKNEYSEDEYVVQWSLPLLRKRLLEKHHETFWVKAACEKVRGREYFRYDTVIHTQKPNASLLPHLLSTGIVTMDYAMHFGAGMKVRDHGYLFKIKPSKVNLLFPNLILISL